MNAEQKTRTARILGYICLFVGTLNLAVAGVHAVREQSLPGLPLLVTGFVSVMMGIFMLALARQKPPSGGPDY